ncbi:SDR family oxidoreductase, partial [bacterium]|nr:SDR family oxidoreductase [bacterium]
MVNKNVLVYGATGGIGQAICRELQNQGFNVYLIARSEKKIKQLAKELDLAPCQAFSINTITSDQNVKKTQEWLMHLKVKISVGIHCAGFGTMKKAAKLSLSEWKELIDVNLTSAFAFFRVVWGIRVMERCEFVYFGSASTDQSWQKNSLYGASKAGLEMFAKSLQKEIMLENGRVWFYKPGS